MNRSKLTWFSASKNIDASAAVRKLGSPAAEGFCNTMRCKDSLCSARGATVARHNRRLPSAAVGGH
jgi:hypothetical protein